MIGTWVHDDDKPVAVNGLKSNLLSVPRSAMFKHKHSYRKPDPLMLLVLFTVLAVLMTSAVVAGEPVLNTMNLADVGNGDLVIAPVGRQGAGLHLSYQISSCQCQASSESSTRSVSSRSAPSSPALFLSLKIPW
ncbi:MAG: hypothetical protein LJE75_00805 [Gammaproteobacteria bacterium]|jgi:hypothetical protein|nr:hypothetical protein [Gammaproteobacteria bacterium]